MNEHRESLTARASAWLPILSWLPLYHRRRLSADLLAGAVVAALVIPQALGYAGIAGVPIQVGLYAVPLALVAYALLGSSRQLIVGPVSTVSVLSGSLVATWSSGDPALALKLTTALAITCGVVLVVTGLLGLGWTAEFLSKPIVTGFVFGLTVVIVVGEIPSILGVPRTSGDVFQQVVELAYHLDDIQWDTLVVGVVSLVLLFAGSRFVPHVPWGLVVLLAGIVVSQGADLAARGVATVGHVPTGLPPLTLPGIPVDQIPNVLFGGVAIALVGLAEGLSAARLFAQSGGYRIESNQELVATGAANIGAGLSGGLGVAGSLSKTAASVRAGGGSQIVGLFAAMIVAVAVVAFIGSIEPLPRAVLSAIVIHAVWGLMDVDAIRRYRRIRRNDFIGCMAALGGVLVFGTLYGLLAAIGLSVLGLVYRSSQVDADVMGKISDEKAAWGSVARHPERATVDGVLVLRLDAPVFWVNAAEVRERILAEVDADPRVHVLILDLESTNQLDVTSADMLDGLLDDLRSRGVDLHLVRVFHFVRRVLRASGFEERLGADHMWHSISQGVRSAKAQSKALVEGADAEATPSAESIAVEDEPFNGLTEDEKEPSLLGSGKQRKKSELARKKHHKKSPKTAKNKRQG